MRTCSSWQFAGSASLVTTAILLWLGVFPLSWPSSASEFSAAFTMAGAPHGKQAANGYGHQIDGNYLAAFAAKDETRDKLPKSAMLLRTLVLVLFYGPALGWLLLACGWRGSRPEDTLLFRCCYHSMVHLHQRRAVATLLGVFLL
jgi:hypothetical protein